MKQGRPIFRDSEGAELIIRVIPASTIPCKVVGVEVHENYYRLVMEVPKEWIESLRQQMLARGEIERL